MEPFSQKGSSMATLSTFIFKSVGSPFSFPISSPLPISSFPHFLYLTYFLLFPFLSSLPLSLSFNISYFWPPFLFLLWFALLFFYKFPSKSLLTLFLSSGLLSFFFTFKSPLLLLSHLSSLFHSRFLPSLSSPH